MTETASAPPPAWLTPLLACPATGGALALQSAAPAASGRWQGFYWSGGEEGRAYPVLEGLPRLMPLDALRPAEAREWLAFLEGKSWADSDAPAEADAAAARTADLLRAAVAGDGESEGSAAWEQAEAEHWDDIYRKRRERGEHEVVTWNRLLPREKHLFRHARVGIEGKAFVEIGCGSAANIARGLNPAELKYRYVGTDISVEALTNARLALPSGVYLQCNAEAAPFQPGAFDGVIALGVLHHMPGKAGAIPKLAAMAKPGGWLLVTEVIDHRSLKPRWLRRFEAERAPHQESIPEPEAIERLRACGEIVDLHREYSPLRGLLFSNLDALLVKSRALSAAAIALDDALLAALRAVGLKTHRILTVATKVGAKKR